MRHGMWMGSLAFAAAVGLIAGVAHTEAAGPALGLFRNECSVSTSASPQWKPAQQGQALGLNDKVRTGEESFAEIRMDADNLYRIKSRTEIQIDQLGSPSTRGDGKVVKIVNVKLQSGELLAKLGKIPDGTVYTVQSPVATAGATGTQFMVRAEGGGTDVAVSESSVTLTALGEEAKQVTVARMQRSTVAPWKSAVLRASGSGILSKAILGKNFVAEKSGEAFVRVTDESPVDASFTQAAGLAIATQKARDKAYRLLQNRIADLPLDTGKSVGDYLMQNPQALEPFFKAVEAEAKPAAQAGGGVVKVSMRVPVAAVEKALGHRVADLKQGFETISLDEYGQRFGAMARLTTLRAAKVDAYRKLAEQIYGSVVTSKTTIRDMAAESDQITSRVDGLVKGAEVADEKYFSDGSVTVTLTLGGNKVLDELTSVTGGRLGSTYMASPSNMFLEDYMGLKE